MWLAFDIEKVTATTKTIVPRMIGSLIFSVKMTNFQKMSPNRTCFDTVCSQAKTGHRHKL